jgi:trans-aconitate methyltransferase
MTKPSPADVREYYDQHVSHKIRDFVDANKRVETAWRTVTQWAPHHVRSVLEIGCGLGSVSWRMASRWPEAQVLGIELSPVAVETATKLFRLPNLRFAIGASDAIPPGQSFDLVLMMDVYEHVPAADRPELHRLLRRALAPGGRIIITVPTADYIRSVRASAPETLQPVDEEIDLATILTMASECRTQLLMFQEVSVWTESDYAHAIMGSRTIGRPVTDDGGPGSHGRLDQLRSLFTRHQEPTRDDRLAMVRSALGPDAYRS